MPTLSIIIPVFNIKNYIARCLDSILQQSYKDCEILLIDDGSTDGSAEICDDYAKQFTEITVIHKKNEGVSIARNTALDMARGEYIMFIDGDDYLTTDSLSAAINSTIQNDADINIFRVHAEDAKGNIYAEWFPFPEDFAGKNFRGDDLFCNTVYYRSSVCGSIYRREFLAKHQPRFKEGIANSEDTIFMAYLYMKSPIITFTNLHILVVTERPNSASRSWNEERFLKATQTIKVILSDLEKDELTDKERSIMEYTIYAIISSIGDMLTRTFSWRMWNIVIKNIKKQLGAHVIHAPYIKRGNIDKKIKMLNISIWLFFFNKYIITQYRIKNDSVLK